MALLAIYDMDRTITRTGTYTPFLIHVAWHRARWRLIFLTIIPFIMLTYALKLISRSKLKEINQTLLIGRHVPASELDPIVQSFADIIIATNICPGAIRQMENDRANGYRIIMATASYRFYVNAIAEKLGIDDVIATESVCSSDGLIAARIEGENCYGPAKLRKITAWMEAMKLQRPLCTIRFYTDHVSDSPVLDCADVAIAVNPSPKLHHMAKKRGWTIVDWRN